MKNAHRLLLGKEESAERHTMASPAELVRAISEVTGVPEKTVINHDRNLAKAGLRTVGGRGTGAAKMTVRDARNLLLAVAGAPLVKDSVVPIEQHANLMPGSGREVGGVWSLPFVRIPELTGLHAKHTFGDALEALLIAAKDGTLEHELRKEVDIGEKTLNIPLTQIEINIVEPLKWASIEVYVPRSTDDYVSRKDPSEMMVYRIGKGRFPANIDRFTGDLLNQHKFSERTLLSIGKLLRETDTT